jgi:leader peptidase (prepilin peptidase) / N-methyltransferase
VDSLLLIFSFALGAVIGSFTNVLIYRVPRGESVAFPPSHCPNCDHQLGVLDLVPIVSWLGLRGKCRYCSNPISGRYPIIEFISGLAYLAIAWKFPMLEFGLTTVALWFLFTMLLAGSAVDLETKMLPDPFTLPLVAVGLLVAFIAKPDSSFPNFWQALEGACIGAGVLALISGFGAYVLRKFGEVKYPTPPLDYQTVHAAALVGAIVAAFAGPWWALIAGLVLMVAHALVNIVTKNYLRIPDWLTFGGLIIALIVGFAVPGLSVLAMLRGALVACGAVAIVCGILWVFLPDPFPNVDEDDLDPVAMGFGDVKLLAAIGAFLGWQGVVFGLAVAILLGAVIGVIGRLLGGAREIPFGPYLAGGAMIALFTGSAPLLTYLRQFGF